MTKEEVREINKHWALRIAEKRDNEKLIMDKIGRGAEYHEWHRARWSALCDLLKSEFAPKLLKELGL